MNWLVPWEPSIAVPAALALAALLYVQSPQPWPRQLCFWLGLFSFYAVSYTQFDYYGEHAFFMHRIQHSVLHHFAPFLVALAWPMPWLRKGMLNHPAIAVSLFSELILFWLIPSVHFMAMLDVRLYRLMNWSMAINGLMFWNLVLNGTEWPPAKRILMMLAVIPPQIIIGMLLFTAPYELYPIYSLCGRVFTLTPLADQQIGGMILWIHGAMMSIAGILVVMAREWITPSMRDANPEHPVR